MQQTHIAIADHRPGTGTFAQHLSGQPNDESRQNVLGGHRRGAVVSHERGHGSLQNGPESSSRSRIAWFCSRVWGRQSGESRSSHQA